MPQLGWLKEAVRPYYLRWLYFPLRPGRRPPAFRDCWQYPFRKLTRDSLPLPEPPSNPPWLLFYPMVDWHARTQRTQHLVQAFAGLGFPCVFLNPHLGREFETVPLFDKTHRLTQLEENIFELHVRLPREPVFHDRLLTAAEDEIVHDTVRQVLPPRAAVIQVLSFPLWLEVARRLRRQSGFPMIYDCHDLLSGFQNICRDLISAETEALAEADLVLFSSQGLLERYGRAAQKSLLVRNAVALQPSAATRPRPSEPPAVGYIGALDSWFDVEAVRQSAIENPRCRFVVAGSIEYPPVRLLASLPNVELPGEVPYRRVPELLSQFRAALIPFAVTPLTLMTNPIKLYEYFSFGLPVVSAPLPEAEAMGDLVYIARTPSEFAKQVSQAVREEDPGRRARRKAIAARENWTARAQHIQAEFGALLGCARN